MEKDGRYFAAGLFVTLGLAALVGFLIWLAGMSDSGTYSRYTVVFPDPVSGLKEGASVQYRGVEVGRVIDIRLVPERKDIIKVDIEVEDVTPIRAATKASLAMQGITGLVYMELTTEVTDTRPPYRMAGEDYPVIEGSGTNIVQLLQDIPAIAKEILEVAKKTNAFLDEENIAALEATVANIERMTRDLNGLLSEENVANVATTLDNAALASADLHDMVARFEETADNIDEAVRTLNEVITKNEGNVNKFTTEGLDQITAMTRETRKMAEAIRKTAEKLEQDPSQILYQPSANGVEIPR